MYVTVMGLACHLSRQPLFLMMICVSANTQDLYMSQRWKASEIVRKTQVLESFISCSTPQYSTCISKPQFSSIPPSAPYSLPALLSSVSKPPYMSEPPIRIFTFLPIPTSPTSPHFGSQTIMNGEIAAIPRQQIPLDLPLLLISKR
jgi:hypothetical protein